MWVGDHAQMDFFVRVPGKKGSVRPWITAWLDWRTRRIVGYHLSLGPNSSTILSAFRRAMLDPVNRGGPGHVSIDNGKDYDAWVFNGTTKRERKAKVRGELVQDEDVFRGLYAELDITAHFSIPYGPNGKSRMERWFRTMHESLGISYESYAGRNAAAKPEMLARVRKNPQLIPTLDQAREDLDRFVAAYNARAGHAIEDLTDEFGNKLSPDRALAAWRDHTRVHDPKALDLFLQHWHKPVRVSRRGIGIAPYGEKLWYGRWDAALIPFKPGHKNGKRVKGREVLVSFDPDDDSAVRVFTTDWKFICEARRDDAAGGNNQEAHRRGAALKRQYKRSLKFVAENPHLAYMSADEALLADEPPAPEDNPPPTEARQLPGAMKIVRTPIDGQSNDVEREQMRQAAGGEFEAPGDDEDDIDVLGELARLGTRNDHEDEDDEADGFSLADLNTPQTTANVSPDGDLAGDDDTDVTLTFSPDDAVLDDEDDEDEGSILDRL